MFDLLEAATLRVPWQLLPAFGAVPLLVASMCECSTASLRWICFALGVVLLLAVVAGLCTFPLNAAMEMSAIRGYSCASTTFTVRLPADVAHDETKWPGGAFVDATAYFPAQSGVPRVPYFTAAAAKALANSSGLSVHFVFTHLPWLKRSGGPGTPCDAPALDGGCPLVIFSHGLCAVPGNYMVLIDGLVKLGCVVVAPTHGDGSAAQCARREIAGDLTRTMRPYVKLEEGTALNAAANTSEHDEAWYHTCSQDRRIASYRRAQLLRRVREARAVAAHVRALASDTRKHTDSSADSNRWARLIDVERGVAYVGHSYGGTTCVVASAEDPHATSAIVWDAWLDEQLPAHPNVLAAQRRDPPTQFVVCEAWREGPSHRAMRRWGESHRDSTDEAPRDDQHELWLPDRTGHHSFNDFVVLAPRVTRAMGKSGERNGVEAAALLREVVVRCKQWMDDHTEPRRKRRRHYSSR